MKDAPGVQVKPWPFPYNNYIQLPLLGPSKTKHNHLPQRISEVEGFDHPKDTSIVAPPSEKIYFFKLIIHNQAKSITIKIMVIPK